MKEERIIIFDETAGLSNLGKKLKSFADWYGVRYVTTNKDLLDYLNKKGEK